jgi:putative flippase GtrA
MAVWTSRAVLGLTGRLHRVTPPAAAARQAFALPRAILDRFQGILRELGKFGVVGAACYFLDVLIFNLVRASTGQPILATTVSTIIATTVAFVGNRFWTWRDRERSGLRREYTLYFGVNLVGLAIGVACLWISHNWLGSYWPVLQTALADNVSGKVIGVGLASLFRFWAYRRFVFRVDMAASS